MSNALVNETLLSIREYLPKLIDANIRLVEDFRENREFNALQLLDSFIEGLTWVVTAAQAINKLERVFTYEGNTINQHFSAINEGLEQGDFVLVADILEYEIAPVLDEMFIESKLGAE